MLVNFISFKSYKSNLSFYLCLNLKSLQIVRAFLLIIALLAFIQLNSVLAQKSVNAEPFSSAYKLQPVTKFEELPEISNTMLLREDEEKRAQRLKVRRFAQMIPVGFHPYNSGTWEETGAGKVWRLGIHSADAYSLYLVFDEFRLAPGVKLFVYNTDFSKIAGAFTSKNNNRFNKFSIAPIPGDAIIIELNIPSGIDDFGELTLGKVGHDYTNEFGSSKLKSIKNGPSEDCEVDINCPEGETWQQEKRAVCKLIVNGELCTGTLINNVSNLKIPYLITANHCVSTNEVAEGGLYIFNYERKICGQDGETNEESLSGAELISTTNHLLDFSLLKLNNIPPLSVKPFFAGWDARPDEPQNGVCIHHPEGDVKKISVVNHPLITSSFGEGYDSLSHWEVLRWDVGATEGGSSGSPIFSDHHRLYGTLTGGSANCTDPVQDYFTKFSLSWDKYPDSIYQLKHWLDPKKRGALFINGMDPYNDSLGTCNTFWNIPQSEFITLSNSNLSWGWLSGHNSKGYTQFAEKFINESTIKISGIYLYVAKAGAGNPFSTVKIKIWEGNSYPNDEIFSKPLYINTISKNAIYYVGLDSAVLAAGNFFVGYEINYNYPDTFAVYQSSGRGANGPSTMYIYNGNWNRVDAITSPAIYTSLSIGLLGCNGTIKVPKSREIEVNPNPFFNDDVASIDLPEGVTITDVLLYNDIGKVFSIGYQFSENKLYLHAELLPAGVYVIELRTKSTPLRGKFIVLRKNPS